MNLNKVILIGRISSDVRFNKTQSGVSIARTRLAVNRNYNNDNDTTDFIPLIAWRNVADFLNQYAPKGSLVAIEGVIVTSNFESNGQNNFVVEVRVDNLHLLEPRHVREQRQTGEFTVSQSNFNGFQNKNKTKTTNGAEPKFNGKSAAANPEVDNAFDNINFNLDDDFE
ncbi:single-stranded DNA-binding protein [Mycoplasmopsis primatum]|uniref:single-stranded DNA-binding protein n=1 Tax=Mycoplasmopsis primatum TaxID=55604 RepID=UPI000497830F|nr:single-stranded DNA-binding protein [Mycoplasmopsis primatum]